MGNVEPSPEPSCLPLRGHVGEAYGRRLELNLVYRNAIRAPCEMMVLLSEGRLDSTSI